MKKTKEFYRGCLLGGAIGDALGWPVEFLSYKQIVKRFGEEGIHDLVCSTAGKAEITDDTQMTLFTAEGILRSETRGMERGICHPPSVVYYAYQRWLCTQGYQKSKELDWVYDGWLIEVRELHEQRAPGNSCLSALSSGIQGSIDEPINNSKGCGGVMRVAPVGLFYPTNNAFKMASDFAALTHGHPSGYLSAGALAYLIANIIDGTELETAVKETLIELQKYKHHEECFNALEKALRLSKRNEKPLEAITSLGEGWVGEEALAISVYCALKYKNDFKKALIVAVNHGGDSDSTGAITGNILGAYLGLDGIPTEWLEKVELKNEIAQIADDLFSGYKKERSWWDQYPGY
ncbi:ADP-ribosylglycohydrolase family protein [Bacillus sp. AK128]